MLALIGDRHSVGGVEDVEAGGVGAEGLEGGENRVGGDDGLALCSVSCDDETRRWKGCHCGSLPVGASNLCSWFVGS